MLPEGAYTWDPKGCELLVHHVPPQPFQLRCVTAIHPEQHTDLEGLFCVGGVYATQVCQEHRGRGGVGGHRSDCYVAVASEVAQLGLRAPS